MSSFDLSWVTFYRDSGDGSDSNHLPEFQANDIGPCDLLDWPMLFAGRSALKPRVERPALLGNHDCAYALSVGHATVVYRREAHDVLEGYHSVQDFDLAVAVQVDPDALGLVWRPAST